MIIFFYFVDFVTSPVQGTRDPVHSAGPSLLIPVGTRDISLVEKLPKHVPWYLVPGTNIVQPANCRHTHVCIYVYLVHDILRSNIPGIYIYTPGI